MEPLYSFAVAICLISLLTLRMKLQPFLSLMISALVYGILIGMGPELIDHLTAGLARVFSTLAVIVFAGSVIAEYLRKTGAVDRIVADLMRLAGQERGLLASGLSGYLVALPAMCCITSYLILEPVVRGLGQKIEGSGTRFQFMAAVSSVISFNLIYPSPVMISLTRSLEVSPMETLSMGLPISLLLLGATILYFSRHPSAGMVGATRSGPLPGRKASWAPIILPLILILSGLIFEAAWLVGNPNVALLLGALTSVALARDRSEEIIKIASRRAGVIIFDLCGAGAFGYVIAQSGLVAAMQPSEPTWVPVVVLPFLTAAILQLAQGSRVVTVVIAAEMMRGYPLDGTTLVFLISAGAFALSYVSDPYFWLVKDTTGSDLKGAIRGYTLPLTLCGLMVFAAATIHWLFLISR